MPKISVYYNSACPVCNAGIHGQKRRMENCPVEVEWLDIHTRPEFLGEIGAEQEFVRKKLHVRDEKGELRIGAEAYRAIFAHTPSQRLLGRLIALPVVRTVARWAYDAFAAALYAWNRANRRW